MSYKKIGDLIKKVTNNKNSKLLDLPLLGLHIEKKFMPSVANTVGTDMSKYQIIQKWQFAYTGMQVGRDESLHVALYDKDQPALITPAYTIFEVIDTTIILPEYLMLYLRRSESDRLGWFYSDSSVRSNLDWDRFCSIELPVPNIERQKKIVEQYNQITNAILIKEKINNNLEKQCLLNYIKLLNGYNTESKELPDGWCVGCIGDYCDVKSGYAFKSSWWTNTGYKVIKIANISNNTINLDSCDCVVEENALKAKDFLAIPGDIMIAMTGATTGKIGIVPICNDNIVVNQRVGKFFLDGNPIEKIPFLFATLIYDRIACFLQPNGTAGSAQDNLSPDDIKRIQIIFPKNELIKSFNNKFKNIIKAIINNWAEIRTMKKIKDIILIKHFTIKHSNELTTKLSFIPQIILKNFINFHYFLLNSHFFPHNFHVKFYKKFLTQKYLAVRI